MLPPASKMKLLLACVAFCAALALPAANIRLAIVPLDPSLVTEADLLTAELSTFQDVALLERAEIEKVRRELNLSSGQEQQALRLGKQLGADGVLLLERRETPALLVLTLVAVKPGVLLTTASYPLPVKDAAQWAKLFSPQTKPFLAKLEVSGADAVPISILNLRSAVKAAQAEKLERSLTVLLIDRLAREQRLFVLERRRMQLLGSEKELSGTTDSPFWSGKWLVEGVIDEEGFSPTEMTVNVRVRGQGDGNPVAIRLRGARTNLTDMVNRLATNVVAALKVQSTLAAWSPADEARQYLEEATWALRWRMFPEAQAASDAAWALGLHNEEAATIRVRSYAEATVPEYGSIHLFMDGDPYRLDTAKPADPKKLQMARSALENYFDFMVQWPATAPAPTNWFALGAETLRYASKAIRHFYYMEETRRGHEELLQQTRSDARAVADQIRNTPQLRDLYRTRDGSLLVYPEGERRGVEERSIFFIQAQMGAYWYDRPSDALALYRGLVHSGYFPKVREQLSGRDPSRLLHINTVTHDPLLVPWEKQDRATADQVWRSFIDEICVSTNPAARLEGWFWKLKAATNDFALENSVTNLFQLFWEQREGFFAGKLDSNLRWGTDAVLKRRATNDSLPIQARLRTEWRSVSNRMARAEERPYVQKAKQYLEQAKTHNNARLFELLGGRAFSPEAARELLPSVLYYKTNSTGARVTVEWLVQQLNRVIQSETNSVTGRTATLPQATPAVQSSAVAPPAPAAWNGFVADTSPITLRHYWKAELPPSEPGHHVGSVRIISTRYAKGVLWLEVPYVELLPSNSWGPDSARSAIFRVTLPSLKSEFIRIPLAERSLAGSLTGTHLEISEKNLFLSCANRIRKYDVASRQWSFLSVPIVDDVVIYADSSRLLLSGKDSIVELDPKTEITRVLASARRKPPVTPLDSIFPFSHPPLMMTESLVQTVLQGRVYELNRASSKWNEVANTTNYDRGVRWQSTSRGLVMHINSPYKWHRVVHYPLGRGAEVLFQNRPPPPDNSFIEQVSDSPVWETPPHMLLVGRAITFDGDDLWLLGPKLSNAPASLFFFDRREKMPFVIPVLDETKENLVPLDPFGHVNYIPAKFPGEEGKPQLMRVPEGLVITGKPWSGFWFIPQADLDAAKKQFIKPNPWNGKEENRNMASGAR